MSACTDWGHAAEAAELGARMSHYDCVGDDIGPILFHRYRLSTHDTPPPVLITFYRGIAAFIRARIAILHLLEPSVRYPANGRCGPPNT